MCVPSWFLAVAQNISFFSNGTDFYSSLLVSRGVFCVSRSSASRTGEWCKFPDVSLGEVVFFPAIILGLYVAIWKISGENYYSRGNFWEVRTKSKSYFLCVKRIGREWMV